MVIMGLIGSSLKNIVRQSDRVKFLCPNPAISPKRVGFSGQNRAVPKNLTKNPFSTCPKPIPKQKNWVEQSLTPSQKNLPKHAQNSGWVELVL